MARKNNSDNLMLVLAIVAVVVSFVAFLMVSGFIGVSGRATDTGYVNATIVSTASIKMNVSTIEFGSGQIAAGGGGVILNSNFSNGQVTPYPSSGTFNRSLAANGGDRKQRGGLIVENDGNVNVNLQVNMGDSAANAICRTIGAECRTNTPPTPAFELLWVRNTTGNPCTTPSIAENTWFVPVVGTITGPFTSICSSSSFQAFVSDRIEVHARITMNDQTPPGLVNQQIIFST